MDPLPLTPFERYMIHDDRPGWPMTFVARLRLRGRLRIPEFAAAAADALLRHPLLHARLRVRGRWMHWDFQRPGPAAVEVLEDENALAGLRSTAIDPRREDGVRLLVRPQAASTEVLAMFHHACTDGVGAYRFIGDLLALYGRRTGGSKLPALAPIDPGRLRRREAWRLERPQPSYSWEYVKDFIKEGWEDFSRASDSIRWGPPPSALDAAWFPAQVSTHLSPEEGRSLRIAAQRLRTNVNDLLLRDLFVVLAGWNADHGREPDGRWLRVTMPTNMRIREDDATPAANIIGYAFLTVAGAHCRDPRALLEEVSAAAAAVRKQGVGRMFVDGVAMADCIPGALGFVMGGIDWMSTAILSNVGDALRRFTAKFPLTSAGEPVAGDVVLEEASGAPPVRPGTTAAFLVSSLAGRTTLGLQVDPQRTTRDQAAALLQRWRVRLLQTASEHGGA